MPVIRFILVLLGAVAFLIAGAALVAEIMAFASEGKLLAKPLGAIWAKNHIASYQAVQVGIERHLGIPWLWGSVVQPLLERAPLATTGAFGVLGLVLVGLARLGRPRARP